MNRLPLHSVSVAGVTVDDLGRVLLIRRRDNEEWQAPGGVLELDETLEDGVIREVLEETGVRVEVQCLTGVYKNITKGVVALVYRCRAIGGIARPSDEASAVVWSNIDQIEHYMPHVFAIRVLDAIDPRRAKPASRTHDGTNLI